MVGTIKGKKVYLKTKRKKKKLVCVRSEPQHNYMKYWRVIRYWAMKTYEVTGAELEMLFFLHDERLFKISQFDRYDNVFSWNNARFYTLKRKGLIHVWREGKCNEARLYELTFKGKKMITNIYKKMNGEEPIPTSERRNPVFKKNGTYSDKVYAMAIVDFNNELKESKQRLDTL